MATHNNLGKEGELIAQQFLQKKASKYLNVTGNIFDMK